MDDADHLKAKTLKRDPEDDPVEVMGAPTSPAKPAAPAAPAAPPLRPVHELMEEALRRAEARRKGEERPIPLPWPELAEQFGGGLWPGVHVLVAGTGAGKTAWALQAAVSAAKVGFPTGYIGLELDDMQIALRLLAEEATAAEPKRPALPWSALYLGRARDDEEGERLGDYVARAREHVDSFAPWPFYVEAGRSNGWPISELEGFIARMRAKHPEPKGKGSLPMLVILDFLQIIGDEPGQREDLRERIGRASYAAREAARQHNVAVLVISSTARANYETLVAGGDRNPGFAAKRIEVRDPMGKPTATRVVRRLERPDMLVGLGKESGEIEFSADSVTAALRAQPLLGDEKRTPVIFATAKGRATGPGWCELRFTGHRFEPSDDGGMRVAAQCAPPDTRKASRSGHDNGPASKGAHAAQIQDDDA